MVQNTTGSVYVSHGYLPLCKHTYLVLTLHLNESVEPTWTGTNTLKVKVLVSGDDGEDDDRDVVLKSKLVPLYSVSQSVGAKTQEMN